MLKKLILSIIECNINMDIISNVDILVMDNDIDKTAEKIIWSLKNNKFKLHYFNHPIKGISNVRNELIKEANCFNPDFLIFIDDDEYATPEWLNELVKTIITNKSDAARGPVLPVFENRVSKYITYWFKRESYINNFQLNSFTTGNLILKSASLKKYNVWFDQRFNYTGSEDCYFGLEMIKKGASIYWAAKAITYESIPTSRATLTWLMKRRYRVAGTFTYILKIEKLYLKLIKKLIISMYFIFSGIMSLIIFLPFTFRYWGILKIAEGLGGLAGFLNIRFKEYK